MTSLRARIRLDPSRRQLGIIARSPRGGGEVKRLDFGISKFQASQSGDMQLTRTGAVLGAPVPCRARRST